MIARYEFYPKLYTGLSAVEKNAYLICMMKSITGSFLASCKWAHDKFTWRDVKYVINGRSGGAGTSVRERITKEFFINERMSEKGSCLVSIYWLVGCDDRK